VALKMSTCRDFHSIYARFKASSKASKEDLGLASDEEEDDDEEDFDLSALPSKRPNSQVVTLLSDQLGGPNRPLTWITRLFPWTYQWLKVRLEVSKGAKRTDEQRRVLLTKDK